MDTPTPLASRGRGRPARIEPEQVAQRALELFVDRGFDRVSMTEVAEAAGVSRRSLFRLFPSKAALVWGGMDEATARFSDAFDHHTDPHDAIVERIRQAYVTSLEPLDVAPEVTRTRLLLIDAHPELYAWGTPQLRELEHRLSERISSAVPRATALGAAALAAAITGSMFAALTWWARNEGAGTIRATAEAALHAVTSPDFSEGASRGRSRDRPPALSP